MTKEQQDRAWGNMPEDVKEYARDLFSNSHIPQYEVLLGLIFGSHNLEADTRKPKFKVGDRVRFGIVGEPMQSGVVEDMLNNYFKVVTDNGHYFVPVEALNHDDTPSETAGGHGGFNGCGSFLDMPYCEVQRMELAKAVAIAYAEKGRYEPSEIGAKAVEVADGVVDRIKKKQQCQ